MARRFAIINQEGKTVFQTEAFESAKVTERLALPDGTMLMLCDNATMQSLREELAEAKNANEAKEEFLSNMSHDIRTPMNAIIGMTALAKKHIDEKTRVMDALNKIDIASSHLLGLINDILDMSRINSGKMKIAEEQFSLSDLLHDTLTIIRPQIVKKNHTFTFSVGDVPEEVLCGDPMRIKQIYVNIISNAIKYTNDGGKIEVTVTEEPEKDGCTLCLSCADNGIGMSPDFLDRIFNPFERVSSSTISRVEGTGLGMSIVKKLIDAMGGTIRIESELGAGTTVTVRIPLRIVNLPLQTEALAGKRVLIIEADEEQQDIFRRYLSGSGVDHLIIKSSSEAIQALTDADYRQKAFHAVILGKKDEGFGFVFDTASYLSQSFPHLALILIGDYDWEEIEYRANRCGIRHFLPLPVFRKTLLNELNATLSSAKEEEQAFGSPDLSGRHILLVEDNIINREIALELLSMTNASVDTAENGQQAVEAYESAGEGYYDLILMDIQMPVMDGYAATHAIRSSKRSDSASIRIIAMTANTFAEDVARARDAGMDGHLAKPIDIPLLMQMLRQFV
ncbi:MAG: response regulator [Clostridia bacterium]|nr:response regulator [Clostridia bacterium]MBQ6475777.1 response regulator [Clostridia bacterium]MBQ6496594.1 response regulator [Bacillota bacterium]